MLLFLTFDSYGYLYLPVGTQLKLLVIFMPYSRPSDVSNAEDTKHKYWARNYHAHVYLIFMRSPDVTVADKWSPRKHFWEMTMCHL